MEFQPEELRPPKTYFNFNGRFIVLKPITLEVDAEIREIYESFDKLFGMLAKDGKILVQLAWRLTENKSDFNGYHDFYKEVHSNRKSTVEWSGELYNAIVKNIKDGMPLIKNKQRYDDLRKIKQSEHNKLPCYAVFYDSLAKRYGYTIEEFFQITLRQLHALLQVIGEKSYEELEVQAALQGRKLKSRPQFTEVTEEEEKSHEDQAMEALKRLQEEHKKRTA